MHRLTLPRPLDCWSLVDLAPGLIEGESLAALQVDQLARPGRTLEIEDPRTSRETKEAGIGGLAGEEPARRAQIEEEEAVGGAAVTHEHSLVLGVEYPRRKG